ncbi:Adenine DNA glycosylase [Entamoeba marina]
MVSEVMLQQTQVSRVLEKYKLWLEKFPTIQKLSKATLTEVLDVWSGLGYNSRCKRLRDLAIEVCDNHKGVIPSNIDDLLKLPGIGPYTANAVVIFSENQDRVTVDANIRRILIHELGLDHATSESMLFAYAAKCLPKGKSRDWHNALMDYGALVATGAKTGIAAKTKQSKFEGSRRSYRSELLRRIRSNEGQMSIKESKEVVKGSKYKIEEIIEGLAKDGIVDYNELEGMITLKD